MLNLALGHGEPALHGLFGLARPPAKASFELPHGRRHDERGDHVRHLGLDLSGALIVDVKYHSSAPGRGAGPFDLRHRCAVQIAVDLGPFQEGLGRNEVHEAAAVDEVVIASVDFVGPRGARRV